VTAMDQDFERMIAQAQVRQSGQPRVDIGTPDKFRPFAFSFVNPAKFHSKW